jgi:hypothetical protein
MLEFDRVEVVNRLHPESVLDIVRNYTTNYDKIWIFDKVFEKIFIQLILC